MKPKKIDGVEELKYIKEKCGKVQAEGEVWMQKYKSLKIGIVIFSIFNFHTIEKANVEIQMQESCCENRN